MAMAITTAMPDQSAGEQADRDGETAPLDRSEVVAELRADQRQLSQRRVDEGGPERGIAMQQEPATLTSTSRSGKSEKNP
jgi:hypothetical protein